MPPKTLEKVIPVSGLGVVAPPPILVQTPVFEGTLATLFRCVREQKIDLMEIPLEPICEAYLLYLIDSKEANLDEAAAALTVLAYLLERKAFKLLPIEDEEEELEAPLELADPTIYAYGDIIQALVSGHDERSRLFFRTSGPDLGAYELPVEIGKVSIADLTRAFERVLRRADPEPVEMLSKPRKSLQEQMKIVLLSLKSDFQTLESMFVGSYTRGDAVYWFLALLELIRLDRAKVALQGEEVLFAKK
jgi:segregation and condensation protein A